MKRINQISENSQLAKKKLEELQRLPTKTYKNTILKSKEGSYKISVYSGELTTQTLIESAKKIMKAFPQLSEEFYDIFQERIAENGFCDLRLIDAVNYVIDNCIYPTPTIASFLSYDKNIKLYTYEQVLKMLDENKKAFKTYKPVYFEQAKKPFYAHVNDIEKYRLTLWNKGHNFSKR